MLSYFKLGLQNHVELQQQQHIDAHAIVQQSNNITKSIAFDLNTIKSILPMQGYCSLWSL